MKSFSLKWLKEFGQDGLCYSVYEDATYCKFCRLFPGGERGVLVEKPFQKWKDAISYFNAHFCNILSDRTKEYHGKKLHLSVITRATEFVKCMEGENLPIIQIMDETSQKQVMRNKAAIKSKAQTVYFLAKQGLPLTGHRGDSKHLEESMNCGNFQELLQFKCEAGEKNLSAHFESCHRSATYRSKIIQNELTQIVSDQILDHIIAKVKKAKFYVVAADEATEAFKHS